VSDQGQDIRQSCSVNGELCINGIRSDFKSDPLMQRPRPCNKWVRLVGKDPQSEKTIDEWCCNEWAKVKIGIENCQMIRHATASTDKVATEVKKHHASFLGVLSGDAQVRLLESAPKLEIEKKDGNGK
jgi:hypothetical protein